MDIIESVKQKDQNVLKKTPCNRKYRGKKPWTALELSVLIRSGNTDKDLSLYLDRDETSIRMMRDQIIGIIAKKYILATKGLRTSNNVIKAFENIDRTHGVSGYYYKIVLEKNSRRTTGVRNYVTGIPE